MLRVHMGIYIIRDFLSQVFFHEEDLADLLTRALHDSQHQREVTPLQLHALWKQRHISLRFLHGHVPPITGETHWTVHTHLRLCGRGRAQNRPGCFRF